MGSARRLSELIRTVSLYYRSCCLRPTFIQDTFNFPSNISVKLTSFSSKSTIVWDITQYSPLKVKKRFGRTYRLYFQGRRISRVKYKRESSAYRLRSRCYLARLILQPLRWSRYVLPKCSSTFNGLHGLIFECRENLKF
jgi:hypothetical protein